MQNQKILYIITKSVWGGAQKYVYDLATNMPKDRFEVMTITGGQGPLVEKLKHAGLRTITLPTLQERGGLFEVLFSFINVRAVFTLIKIFRHEKPDVIHLNSSKIGGIGGVAAFIFKLLNFFALKPLVVYTIHGWPFKESRPWWQRWIIFCLSWFSIRFVDKVILINTADHHTALKFLPQIKCVLIFNGTDEIDFLPRDEARSFFAKKINRRITPDTIVVGTVAELTKNKGLNHLIDAANQINPAPFHGVLKEARLPNPVEGCGINFQTIIVGNGGMREELQRQINKNGLQNTVFLAGAIPDASYYLGAFDIFVLPSLKEGLPYTIMEAMAAGIPIVATTVGGIPDLITHEKEGLLVPPNNPQKLRTTLQQLIIDSSLRQKLGANGAKKIKDSFPIDRMVQKTIALYESR